MSSSPCTSGESHVFTMHNYQGCVMITMMVAGVALAIIGALHLDGGSAVFAGGLSAIQRVTLIGMGGFITLVSLVALFILHRHKHSHS